jgi:hypothetical protein
MRSELQTLRAASLARGSSAPAEAEADTPWQDLWPSGEVRAAWGVGASRPQQRARQDEVKELLTRLPVTDPLSEEGAPCARAPRTRGRGGRAVRHAPHGWLGPLTRGALRPDTGGHGAEAAAVLQGPRSSATALRGQLRPAGWVRRTGLGGFARACAGRVRLCGGRLGCSLPADGGLNAEIYSQNELIFKPGVLSDKARAAGPAALFASVGHRARAAFAAGLLRLARRRFHQLARLQRHRAARRRRQCCCSQRQQQRC